MVVRGTHTKLDGKRGKVVRLLKHRRRAVVRFDSRSVHPRRRAVRLRNLRRAKLRIRKGDRVVVRGTRTKLDGKKGTVVRVLRKRRRAVVRFDSRSVRPRRRTVRLRYLRRLRGGPGAGPAPGSAPGSSAPGAPGSPSLRRRASSPRRQRLQQRLQQARGAVPDVQRGLPGREARRGRGRRRRQLPRPDDRPRSGEDERPERHLQAADGRGGHGHRQAQRVGLLRDAPADEHRRCDRPPRGPAAQPAGRHERPPGAPRRPQLRDLLGHERERDRRRLRPCQLMRRRLRRLEQLDPQPHGDEPRSAS